MEEFEAPFERHFRAGRRRGFDPGEHGRHGHRGHGFGPGRRWGRPGGWQQADLPPADDAPAWLAGRLPEGWFTGPPEVTVDREEITVIGELPPPEGDDETDAALGRISRFR